LYHIVHNEVADEFITSQNTDFAQFFIIKPRHTGRPKKQIWVEKTLSGRPGRIRKNAYYRKLKWTFKDSLPSPCYCYAIKTKSTTNICISLRHL